MKKGQFRRGRFLSRNQLTSVGEPGHRPMAPRCDRRTLIGMTGAAKTPTRKRPDAVPDAKAELSTGKLDPHPHDLGRRLAHVRGAVPHFGTVSPWRPDAAGCRGLDVSDNKRCAGPCTMMALPGTARGRPRGAPGTERVLELSLLEAHLW